MNNILTIPKSITHGEELLLISLKDYEALQKHLAEVRHALEKIRQGEKELKKGKTKIIKSLSELRS